MVTRGYADTRAGLKVGELVVTQSYDPLRHGVLPPCFRAPKLSHVTAVDVERVHRSLSGIPYNANRALAVLSVAFKMAERWGIVRCAR